MTRNTTTPGPKSGAADATYPCWECKTPVGADHFCLNCGKIQPLPHSSDYFSFLGLPRKLGLDPAALERRFHQLSWKLHPDNFPKALPYEQELSLDKSAVLNDAYRTLRDPVARTEYLLGLEGVRREGEAKQQAPPDLLAEVFELNEHLEELREAKRAGGDARQMQELRHQLEQARDAFQEKLEEVLAELRGQFEQWDKLVEAGRAAAAPRLEDLEPSRRAVADRLSAILNRHSYIRNLVRNVTDELQE